MSLKHDIHMIACPKEIFERWMKVMDLYMQGSLVNKYGVIKQKDVQEKTGDNESALNFVLPGIERG